MWQKLTCLSLLWGTIEPLRGDDFDFGAEAAEPTSDPAKSAPSLGEQFKQKGLEATFKVGLRHAHQVGEPSRQIFSGFTFNEKATFQNPNLKIHLDANQNANHAFRAEDDPLKVRHHHEFESILREGYAAYIHDVTTLTAGRKMVIVGKNDLISLLDVVSPQDTSEALFARPENSRLGQDLVGAELSLWGTQLWMGYAPKPQMNRRPQVGHPYNPMLTELDSSLVDPSESYANLSGSTSSWDWSILLARTHLRDPLVVGIPQQSLREEYHSLQMSGIGLTYVWEPVLLKTEVVSIPQYPFVDQSTFEKATIAAHGLSLGVDYMSDHWGQWIIETNRLESAPYFNSNSSNPTLNQTRKKRIRNQTLGNTQMALSYSKSYLNETLNVSLTLMALNGSDNQIRRLEATYKISDQMDLHASLTQVAMDPNHSTFKFIEGYDRVELGLFWYTGT